MKKAVFALANNEEHAQRIVNRLLEAGFSNDEVSVLMSDTKNQNLNVKETFTTREGNRSFTERETREVRANRSGFLGTEKHTKAPEGGTTGAITGGIIGGAIGLLAGLGTLAIPGLGVFIAAGPILAALSGSAIGGSLGLLIGALIGLGIPEYEAKKYENSLRQGHVLICVHVSNANRIDTIKQLLKEEGAHDICTSWEKAGVERR